MGIRSGCGWAACSRRDRPGPRNAAGHSDLHHLEGLRRLGRLHAVLRARPDRQDQREQARAGLVLPGGRRRRAAALQPNRCRQCDVRRGRQGRRRRARCGGRQADMDDDRAGPRARPHLLGKRRPIRSAAAAQYRRRPPRHRRDERHAHQVVRQGRVRRHAYWRTATARGTEQDPRPHLRKPDRDGIQHG